MLDPSADRSAFGAVLSAFVDRSPTPVLLVDDDRRIRYGNDAALQLFGTTSDGLVQSDYDDVVVGHIPVRDRGSIKSHGHLDGHDAPRTPLPMAMIARHRSGAELEVTVEFVTLPPPAEQFTGVILRDTVTVHRTVRRLSATVEVLAAALSRPGPAAVEERAAELGRHVLDADMCVIDRGQGRVSHVMGQRPDQPRPPDDLVDLLCAAIRALRPGRVVRIDGDELGTIADPTLAGTTIPELISELVVAPMHRNGSPFGHVTAVRFGPSRPFPAFAEHMTNEYANAVAMAFDLWSTRDELDRLHWMVDHDRIARDLHDTVIQRLFATALRLESAIQISEGPTTTRINEAVAEIDGVINDVRTAIFNLRRPATSQGGLRSAVAAEVDGFANVVGFVPRLRFTGVIDGAALPDGLADTVIAVVRELLANITKHARAAAVDVSLGVEDGALRLEVTDDGIGIAEHRVNGDGLANLSHRAAEFGGKFEIGNHPEGTVARWTIPIPAPPRER